MARGCHTPHRTLLVAGVFVSGSAGRGDPQLAPRARGRESDIWEPTPPGLSYLVSSACKKGH